MLGRSGQLAHVECPFFTSGLCERPYCHFRHEEMEPLAPIPELPETAAGPDAEFSGYMASMGDGSDYSQDAPAAIVQQECPDYGVGGYVGYFGSMADPSLYRPDRPTTPPPRRPGGLLGDSPPTPARRAPPPAPRPKTSIRDIKSMINAAPKKAPASEKPREVRRPPPPIPRAAGSINELAKNLSDIDRQIAALKSQMESGPGSSDPLTAAGLPPLEEEEPPPPPVPALPKAKRKDPIPPKPAKSSASGRPAYTPTPLSELERRRRKEEKRKRKELLKAPAVEKAPPPPEKVPPKEANSEAQESADGEGSRLELVDLFGDEAEEEEYDPCAEQTAAIPAYKPGKPGEKRKRSPEKYAPPESPALAGPAEPLPEKEAALTEPAEKPPEKPKKKKKKRSPSPPPEMTSRAELELVPMGRRAHAAGHALDSDALRSKAKSVARGSLAGPKETLAMRYQELKRAKEEMLKRVADATAGNQAAPAVGGRAEHQGHRVGAPMATVAKGETRRAHVPKPDAVGKRPTVGLDSVGKVPSTVRNRYLSLFIDEALKFARTQDEAFATEEAVNGRAKTKGGYLSAAVQAIKRLRETAIDGVPPKAAASGVSHSRLLVGSRQNFTTNRGGAAAPPLDLTRGSYFYTALGRYVLSEEELDANGFPRPPLEGMAADAAAFHALDGTNPGGQPACVPDEDLARVCCRCGAPYRLTAEGAYVVEEDCVYHWGRSWMGKSAGSWERRFSCCKGDAAAPGCAVAVRHVSDALRESDAAGYVTTQPLPPNAPLDEPRRSAVYSLDCEMVYTVWGIGLARVTVVDVSLQPVLDAVVLPASQIVDCNSRFSGLTPAHFNGVTTSLRDVQSRLLSLVSAETVLMGHSLESDLRALRLVHSRVVDTSVVFPHRKGPPFKRALRNLTADILQKIIQDSVSGHDSSEDAGACMQLMLWKVREDAKVQKKT